MFSVLLPSNVYDISENSIFCRLGVTYCYFLILPLGFIACIKYVHNINLKALAHMVRMGDHFYRVQGKIHEVNSTYFSMFLSSVSVGVFEQ